MALLCTETNMRLTNGIPGHTAFSQNTNKDQRHLYHKIEKIIQPLVYTEYDGQDQTVSFNRMSIIHTLNLIREKCHC